MKKYQMKWLVLIVITSLMMSCAQEEEYVDISTNQQTSIENINVARIAAVFGLSLIHI